MLADSVQDDPSGRRYLVVADPDIGPSDLPAQARRLADELDAVVVLLLPGARAASLRIGVSVPGGLTRQLPATTVLDRVLALTGGRGGGSAAFAQGGALPDDLPALESQICTALLSTAP